MKSEQDGADGANSNIRQVVPIRFALRRVSRLSEGMCYHEDFISFWKHKVFKLNNEILSRFQMYDASFL
jgi:hypothetical protein